MLKSLAQRRGEPATVGHGAYERRSNPRHVAVRWPANLRIGTADELCLIHNVCAAGLTAEICAPHRIGEEVRIEISDTLLLHGTIAWANDTNAEIRFPHPINVAELIALYEDVPQRKPPGPPRLAGSCQGWLELGRDTVMVEVCDLSQGGARIAADVVPAIGQRAVLAVHGLAPIAGEVRWRDEGNLGIAFDEPIPFDVLTDWIVARDARIGLHGRSRRWPRYSILLKTEARLMDVAQPVETIVHNISRGGVLVSCRRGLRDGDHVELELGPAGPVAGRVAWVGEGHAGIEFNRTIDAGHVLHPLGGRTVPPVLCHHATGRRPGLHSHRTNPAPG